MTELTVREALIAGKARLTEDSWRRGANGSTKAGRRGTYGKDDGTWCAQEAIHYDEPLDPHQYQKYGDYAERDNFRELVDALHAQLRRDDPDAWLTTWNDAEGRTLAEVHELYDRAIEAAA